MTPSPSTSEGARALAVAVALTVACSSSAEPPGNEIPVGLMLSYTGVLAATSINSEHALRMAIEAANAAGGVGGRPIRVVVRDTGSDAGKVTERARELQDLGVAVTIGPDTDELVTAARPSLIDHTVILPSAATSTDVMYKAASWFAIGATVGQMTCGLYEQLHADQRTRPLIIYNPTGYNVSLSWTLTNQYGLPRYVLPTNMVPTTADLRTISRANADSFVLLAVPSSGVALVHALLASGELGDPKRWYLSPTLHSAAFLDLIPKGGMTGARGVAQGSVATAAAFRDAFQARWNDRPQDDAYPFFDAGALAVLALQRALARQGSVPSGTGLTEHIIKITEDDHTPIAWNQLGEGLDRLRRGEEITYSGLSGRLRFDANGQTPGASSAWWTIGADSFIDGQPQGDCK